MSNFLSAVKAQSEPIGKMYFELLESKNVDALLDAIRKEEKIYLDILFQYYDECILFSAAVKEVLFMPWYKNDGT